MCLKLGIDDPEQWLEDCPERVYEVWDAYSRLEPWWGERELLARLLAAVRCLLAGNYAEDKVAAVMKNADDIAMVYMPYDYIGQPERKAEASIEDVQKQLESRFG